MVLKVLNMTRPGTFQKGHNLAIGSRGQIRRDLTIELISQLNEIFDKRTGQTNLQRVVSNLVAQAAGADEYDEKGKLVKRGTGDLAVIKEIFDRVEGRAPQNPTVEVEQEKVEFKTIEEVKTFFLERGIDVERLAPPFKRTDQEG
jgi:hypothetical protein